MIKSHSGYFIAVLSVEGQNVAHFLHPAKKKNVISNDFLSEKVWKVQPKVYEYFVENEVAKRVKLI